MVLNVIVEKDKKSGGIIVYMKEKLFLTGGMQKIKSDKNIIWLVLYKHAFNLQSDIFVCTVYTSPRVKATCPVNDEFFINLKDFSLKGKIILTGDFNARTGTLNDFAEFDHITRVDDEVLPTNYLEDIILPIHNNVDEIINEQGFVCVEVLRPSQPNVVMSSAVSLPNHTFTGHA